MAAGTWAEPTGGLREDDLALPEAFRAMCVDLPDTEERVSRTQVAYAVRREFASAHVKSHWLEVAVHLAREVEHPRLRAAFATTRTVVTHRLTIGTLEDLGRYFEGCGALHFTLGLAPT